jgi:hypothetical protein
MRLDSEFNKGPRFDPARLASLRRTFPSFGLVDGRAARAPHLTKASAIKCFAAVWVVSFFCGPLGSSIGPIGPAVGRASCSALIGRDLAVTFSHHCAEYFGVIQFPPMIPDNLSPYVYAAGYTWQHCANSTMRSCT